MRRSSVVFLLPIQLLPIASPKQIRIVWGEPMDLPALTAWIKARYGAEPEYLWADYPDAFVFRHAENRKWFGVVMEVERSKLGLSGPGRVWLLDVKTGPLLGGSYLGQPGIVRAWHMNKTHWLGVLLDGSAPEQTVQELADLSFSLTE